MAQDPRKSELIGELARARGTITANVRHLRADLNVVGRVEAALRRHQLAWLAGASVCGFLLAKLPARNKKTAAPQKNARRGDQGTAVKAGLLVTALKLAFDIARPMLTKWLARRVASYAETRFANGRHV